MALTEPNSPPATSDAVVTGGSSAGSELLVDTVQSFLGGRAVVDFPVAELTTYKVGGRARFYFLAESMSDLEAVSALRRDTGIGIVVLGRGSNVLFADAGYSGLVLQLGECAASLEIPTEDVDHALDGSQSTGFIRAGGSVPLPVVARQTAHAGWRGFEWAVGVPGTIGGGVRMNAGGHGSDMAETLHSVDIFDLRRGMLNSVPAKHIGLRFRGSALSDTDIVLRATLALQRGAADEATAVIEEIVKWRRAHQPGGQNAGSVFVNPVPHEVSAGELIDRCGRRGFRVGTAHVSAKHANFIQSEPQGTAGDVIAVMREVRAEVARQTGYLLRSEVRLIGFSSDVVDELSPDHNASQVPVGDS